MKDFDEYWRKIITNYEKVMEKKYFENKKWIR